MSIEAAIGASVVERAARGDDVAFARLVARYHPDLMRVAYVTCGDAELAQDAVQAAWLIAWRKLGSLRDPAKVKGWLVSVAANEARQVLRRRRPRAIAELAVEGADGAGPDPAWAIERIDLVNAMSRLKPEDRMLLALRYVAGFDSTELGQLVGMSPSGTRARLARLLEHLRGELDHD